MAIENHPQLEKILVKKKSLINVNSLKICNNERLKVIEIEDGEEWKQDGVWYANGAFYNAKSITLESILSTEFTIN